MSAILIENDLVHYEVLGRGRPVLFLHSWIGSWRYWIPSMQSISIGFRAYSLDFWGFGDSAKNQKYLIEDQVRLVNQFLDKLGIFRIAIVGHGLGGLVALELAKMMPEAIDRIFLISTPFTNELIAPRLFNNLKADFFEEFNTPGLDIDVFYADLTKNDQNAISAIIYQNTDISENLLEKINGNCLFVHGRNDPLILIPPSILLNQLSEKHHAIIFEQSGHFPMIEENNKFNRLLNDFLSLESGESIRDLRLKEEWKRRVR